jgi:hypothetical protein
MENRAALHARDEHPEQPCSASRSYDFSPGFGKDFPLFAAFEALFLNPCPRSPFGDLMKLDDPTWLISNCISLLGVGFSR